MCIEVLCKVAGIDKSLRSEMKVHLELEKALWE